MRTDFKMDSKRESRLPTEVNRLMERETIIFFDNLGFGWVLDKTMVKEMKLRHLKDNCSNHNSLMQILENLFNNPLI